MTSPPSSLPDIRALDVPLTAIAMDGRLDVAAVAERLSLPRDRRTPYGAVFRAGETRIHLFAFGAAVLEGYDDVDAATRKLLEDATGRRCLPETAETFRLLVDASHEERRPRVGWDRVVLRDREPTTVEAVALLLGQSAALDRYARETDALLVETQALARHLEERGRLPRSPHALSKRVGRILARRVELARWFFLLDRPEAAWEDPRVYQLHEALAENLELTERHRDILHKLETVENAVDTLIDLWQGRRSISLETAIVGLIVLEIVMALTGMY